MNREQFDRWKDFALRMARTVYSPTMRDPSRKWIIEQVEEFLAWMEDDYLRITDWDSTWADSPPHYYPCVSDEMSRFEWDRLPYSVRKLEGEDGEKFEEGQERWFGPIRCCVRAGLDMASEPSAGVVGFTLGDLRKMYPEGLPDWLAGGFRNRRGKPYTVRGIKRMADDVSVWL
jgi:hypothetical protein